MGKDNLDIDPSGARKGKLAENLSILFSLSPPEREISAVSLELCTIPG